MRNNNIVGETAVAASYYRKERDYWLNKLSGNLEKTAFPYDHKGEPGSFPMETYKFQLTRDLFNRIMKLCGEYDHILHMCLLAGVMVVGARYTGNKDIIIGAPIYRQEEGETFINTVLALRNQLTDYMSFKELLLQVKQTVIESNENLNYPIETLVDKLGMAVSQGEFPLFDIVVLLENIHDQGYISHIHVNMRYCFTRTADSVTCRLEYNPLRYRTDTVERIAAHFMRLLNTAVFNVDLELSEIDILSEEEKKQLLVDFNHHVSDYPKDRTVCQLFRQQVEQTPSATAAADENRRLTYQELNDISDRWAAVLRAKGAAAENIVALQIERTVDMITGIMAILKAGAAYLPIDTQYPQARIRFILKDSGACLLLTREKYTDQDYGIEFVTVEDLENSRDKVVERGRQAAPGQPAYVLYTSGSTGQPKGVVVEHRNLVNLVHGLKERIYSPYTGSMKVALVAPYFFDASVQQIFAALLLGHSLYIVPEDCRIDGEGLLKFYETHEIEISDGTPPHLSLMLENFTGDGSQFHLKHFLIGGESLPPKLTRDFLNCFAKPPRLTNVYGPAECCVDSVSYEISNENINILDTIPIGTPMPNVKVYILAPGNTLQPIGVPGELHISGNGVGRGYLNKPELTAEKYLFMSPGFNRSYRSYRSYFSKKFYKTGDLGRWLPNENIEFLGRTDFQVKVRGFRIELGEIENCLLDHQRVKEAVVIIHRDREEENHLCAYMVTDDGQPVPNLREYLSGLLPDYMIPTYFTILDKMPLTPNGKVDRKKLPEPEITARENYTAPRNELEEKLAEIWSDVLQIEKSIIGIDDNFFERGGHSLKATVMVNRVHKILHVKIPLVKMFENPTIRGLSRHAAEEAADKCISIETAEKKEYYPLSSAQQRLYILQQKETGAVTYNIPLVANLEGHLDKEKLLRVFQRLIRRHESLRTSFQMIDENPGQRIRDNVEFEIENSNPNPGSLANTINNFIHPFDLSRAPLLRVALAKTGENPTEHLLMLDMHHIITDGTSQTLLTGEFLRLYAGKELPPLALQYKDYSEWQNSSRQQESMRKQEAYWLSVFEDEIPVLNLPTDYARTGIQDFSGGNQYFELSIKETGMFNEMVRSRGVTLFIALLAVHHIFLSKICGQEDIVVGVPTAGRKHADLERIIGMFVNTLSLRLNSTEEETFRGFLGRVKKQTLEAFENQDYPLEALVEKLPLTTDPTRNPLFDAVFALQNLLEPRGESPKEEKENLKIKPISQETDTAKFDLTLVAFEKEEKLRFTFEYRTKLFKDQTVARFILYFKKIISTVLENPGIKISDIDIITEEERRQVLYDFNHVNAEYPMDNTLQGLFAGQVERTPHHIALEDIHRQDRQQCLSFGELNKKADQLAHYLGTLGVKENHLVGIMVERSIEMIIGILGVLKAGAGYVPVNPKEPAARSTYILDECNVKLLLTQSPLIAGQEAYNRYRCIVEYNNYSPGPGIDKPGAASRQSSTLAYVIFTSGSTGKPKGVPITHYNILPLLGWGIKSLGISVDDRALQNLAYYFDWSVWEIFINLISGVRLYMVPDRVLLDPMGCARFMEEHGITVLHVTPTQWQHLLTSGRGFEFLNYLFIGAERLTRELVQRGLQKVHRGCRVFNMYGPTEATIIASVLEIHRGDEKKWQELSSVPIGIPVGDTTLLVLDPTLNLSPVNITGELHIAGKALTRGYLNRPEITRQKFIPNPYPGGNYLYKTGDLVRWLPDGTLEFLGRIDHQVKIRGNRIELGEIENRLLDHRDITDVVVINREDESGEMYLCAYTVSGKDLDTLELREFLTQKLPAHMIPSSFVRIENIPLTPNGKLDRKALPVPETKIKGSYTPPGDWLEERLAEIWSEELGIDKNIIGIDDDFFALGGHSLKATRMTAKVCKAFAVDIPLIELFVNPTIRGLAGYMKRTGKVAYSSIEAVEERDYYELSYAQRRLWVLCQFEEDSTAYNMPVAAVISGELAVDVFKGALQTMAHRHDSLRTVFVTVDGEPHQKITRDFRVNLEQADLRELDDETKENEARRLFVEDANKAFNLETGPLFRVKLVRLAEGKYLLIYNIHHIINDGWSQGIIRNEVIRLYNAYGQEQENPLPRLEFQYKDYSAWHNLLITGAIVNTHRQYWLEKFKDKPNGIELPLDYSRKPIQTFNGGRVPFTINNEQALRLQRLSLRQDATLFMSLLTLLNIFLYKYSGQKDIIIGAPIAGRKQPELYPIIGFLVNTLVYRTTLDPQESFMELLEKVKLEALTCYKHQDYPFDLLVEELGLDRDLSQSPLFNVMLAHNNADTDDTQLKMDGVTISGYPHSDDFNMSKFDLIFFMDETDDGVHVRIEYNSDLFNRGSIERMAGNFLSLLDKVIEKNEQPIAALSVLSEAEHEKVIHQFNQTRQPFARLTLQEIFENQVERSGNKTAVVFNDDQISYIDLNREANRLAHYLRESCGVKPNDIIGVSMDRSIDMITVLLGIIKSGAAYLALDPTYPRDRVLYILGDCQARLLIIDKDRPSLFEGYQGTIINMNFLAHRENINRQSPENPRVVNRFLDILYINYTSGTTGTPNGAMLSHATLTNLIRWQNEITSIDCSLRCLQFTSINFCVSFQEIAGTLTAGGELHLIDDIARQDIDYLMDFLSQHRIEILFLPFSYLNFLFNESGRWDRSFNHHLKHIITAGEQLKITTGLKRFLDLNPGLKLHNHYGSTEMHVVTSYTLDSSTAAQCPIPPAGKPIANVKIYILDECFNPVPVGVWGELCVAGSCEIPGYINNSKLTGKKLLNHPELSDNGKRLFRSGDMGRWLENGNIELRGRQDFLVKVRGFRVEPGEIESRILSIEAVRECVVVVKEDQAGEKYLVAYTGANQIEAHEIKKIIAADLPQYMIPQIVLLDSLPLMPNGKVDRERLPEPGIEAKSGYIAPGNEEEEILVEIWSEILALQKDIISINANFFELGGHSLKAAVMVSRIHKRFNKKIPLAEIFRAPTIKEIAAIIKDIEQLEYTAITTVEKKEYYVLSPAQKRLYILQEMLSDNTGYNLPAVMRLEGRLDREQFEKSFKQLIARHESLRTSFLLVENEPVQKVHNQVVFEIENYSLEPGSQSSTIKSFIRPFDLACAPLLRVGLIKEAEHGHILMIDMHHIISDGTSLGILAGEFMSLYSSGDEDGKVTGLPALKVRYKDYSEWRSSDNEKAGILKQKKYWQKQFEDEVPVLHLPVDYPRPVVQRFEGSKVFFEIPPEQTAALKKIALQQEATLYMILLALYTIFLTKISGSEDIVVGTPTAGRRHSDLEPIIGMFVNTLCIKNSPREEDTFNSFLQQVKAATLAAFENQDYPFEELVENVEVNRDTSRNPLFDVMFVLQNLDMPVIRIPGLQLKPYPAENKTAKFDMTFQGFEEDDKLKFTVEYSTNLFREETIKRLVTYFKKVAASVLEPQPGKIAEIEIITAEEKKQVLYDFNDTRVQYPEHKPLQQLFAEQAERIPGHTALVGTGLGVGTRFIASDSLKQTIQVTYGVLNEKSNQLAYLLKEKGVQTDIIVGIMMERSLEMLTGIMAILKAGGAYLPIDPDYPEERKQYMLKDSGAKILLTGQEIADIHSPQASKIRPKGTSSHLHLSPAPVTCLAYVTYTSGSTGKPKGVMIEHRPVMNFIKGITDVIPFGEKDCILSLTTITFDIFGLETLLPLTAGSTVVMGTRQQQSEAAAAARVIQQENITIFQVTPSRLQLLLAHPEASAALKLLDWLLVGGEALPAPLLEKAKQFTTGKIYNLYGPTETTIWSTLKDVTGENALNIGKPTANTQIYIVNKSGHLQPVGIPGELLIGGHGVARGYLNNPELTAERFGLRRPGESLFEGTRGLAPLFLKGTGKKNMQSCNHASMQLSPNHSHQYPNTPLPHHPIYLTGDLARWLPDGNIEFFQRMDQQVKIRGYRIEPGEIENRILELETVKEAVVTIKEITGDKHLCAYIVPAAEQNSDTGELSGIPGPVELRDRLSTVLPGYMIPSFFIILERIPLTPSGKVNRKLLPEPRLDAGGEYTAPRDKQEQDLVKLWSLVLGAAKESIGIDANFFRLGGHSLKAMILASHIHKAFNVRVPLPIMFNNPTIRGLSGYIKAAAPETYVPIENVEQKDYYELSYHQGRLWFIYQVDPMNSSYNMPGRITFNGKVKAEAVKKALYKIVQRHDSLRTGFRIVDTGPVQFIKEEIDIPFEHIDIVSLSPDLEERKKKREAIINQLLTTPFVLENPPLFRSALLEADTEYEFIFNVHHIVFDGWSMAIVKKEFLALVDAYTRDAREPALPPLEVRYRDFARWQNRRAADPEIRERSHRYWLKKLGQGLPELNLPTDLNPVSRTGETAAYVFVLGEDIKDRLMQMAVDKNISLFMVMFSALNLLLARITGQQDILTGIAAAGREHAALQPIVGFFVSSVIFISHVNPDGTFADFLDRMEKNTLEVLQNQDYPFELVIEDLKMRFPNIPVMFNMLNMGDVYEPGLETLSHPREPYHIETVQDVKFQQELYVSQYKNAIEIQIHYRKALFKPATIEYMMGEYKKLLHFVIENPLKTLNDYGKRSNKQKFSRGPGKPGKC